MGLTTDEVMVTTGSQQLLALLADVLLDPGDIVLTEAPTYFVYQGVLQGAGARVLSVPMDEQGMDTDALEALLRRLERSGELGRVKLIYTCDYYQNPTGLTLAPKRSAPPAGIGPEEQPQAAHPDPRRRRLPRAALRRRRLSQRQSSRREQRIRRLDRHLFQAVRPWPQDRLRHPAA